jgi:TonB family protein
MHSENPTRAEIRHPHATVVRCISFVFALTVLVGPVSVFGAGQIQEARVVKFEKAEYPSEMLRAKISGKVNIQCKIGKNGELLDAHVIESTNIYFTDSALYALRHWQFQPKLVDSEPVETTIVVPFKFTHLSAKANPGNLPKPDWDSLHHTDRPLVEEMRFANPKGASIEGSARGLALRTWDRYYIVSAPGGSRNDSEDFVFFCDLPPGPQTIPVAYVGNRSYRGLRNRCGPCDLPVVLVKGRLYALEGEVTDDDVTFIVRDKASGEVIARSGPVALRKAVK